MFQTQPLLLLRRFRKRQTGQAPSAWVQSRVHVDNILEAALCLCGVARLNSELLNASICRYPFSFFFFVCLFVCFFVLFLVCTAKQVRKFFDTTPKKTYLKG